MTQPPEPQPRAIQGSVVDDSGRALAGAAVANEEQIVLSDARGRFTLPFVEGRHGFVWVTRPEGFTAGRWYQRLPLDGEARFVLKRAASRAGGVRIAHVTDLHLRASAPEESPYGPEHLRRTLADVLALGGPVEVVIATGDLTDQGDRESLAELRRILDAQPVPVLAHFGGHDGLAERKQGEAGLPHVRFWQEAMGPTHYSLDIDGWHVVLYSDETHFFGPAAEMHAGWLDADLDLARRAGKPILLARHTPPDSKTIEALGRRGVRVILHGHWHSSKVMEHAGVLVLGTPPQVFGGIDTMPAGVRVVELSGDHVDNRYLPLRSPRPEPKATGDALEAAWESHPGSNLHRGEPLVEGDSVYLPIPDEEYRGRAALVCLEAHTGALRWHTPTPHSVRGGPAVSGETLFAVTQPGEVLALDKATGRLLWSRRLEGYPDRWIYNGPAVAAAIVVAGTGAGRLEGLCAADGTPAWSYPSGARGSDAWPQYCTPAVHGGRVVVMRHRQGVACLDAATGEEQWSFDCPYEYHLAAPLLAGRLVLVPASGGAMHALDFETGSPVWAQTGGGSGVVAWASDGDLVVLHTLDGPTEAWRLTDGELLWRFQGGPDLLDLIPYRRGQSGAIARPVLTTAGVLVLGLDGCVSLLDRQTGAARAALPLGEAVVSAAPAPDGSAIAALWGGRVVMVRAKAEGGPVPAGPQNETSDPVT